MGDLGLVPMTSGWVSLILEVSFSSSRASFSARFPMFPYIGDESSCSTTRSKPASSSLASPHSSSHPPIWGLLPLYASLYYNIRLFSLSCLLTFLTSSFFISSIPLDLISFHNTSDCFIAFLPFCATTSQQWRLSLRLTHFLHSFLDLLPSVKEFFLPLRS
jgi:hypothetical protein